MVSRLRGNICSSFCFSSKFQMNQFVMCRFLHAPDILLQIFCFSNFHFVCLFLQTYSFVLVNDFWVSLFLCVCVCPSLDVKQFIWFSFEYQISSISNEKDRFISNLRFLDLSSSQLCDQKCVRFCKYTRTNQTTNQQLLLASEMPFFGKYNNFHLHIFFAIQGVVVNFAHHIRF